MVKEAVSMAELRVAIVVSLISAYYTVYFWQTTFALDRYSSIIINGP